MALYRVALTVTLETYARTEEEAVEVVRRAIRHDSRLAGPEPGTPMFGAASVTVNPDRQ